MSTYVDIVLSTDPTYYWPMQDAIRIPLSGGQLWWPPAAGQVLLSAGGPSYGSRPVPGPFGEELGQGGDGAVVRFAEHGTTGFTQTVNANRNSTAYAYMAWARLVDSSDNSAIMGNWNGNNGTMLHTQGGGSTSILSYHNGVQSASGVKDTKWHCWIVSWDGSTQKTYQDGTQTLSVARSGALGSSTNMELSAYAGGFAGNMELCHFAWWENKSLDVGTVQRLSRKA